MAQTIYRLACLDCERDDCDGISEIPVGWQDVTENQSLEDSYRTEPLLGEQDFFTSNWWTHIGLCPDCQRQHEQEAKQHADAIAPAEGEQQGGGE